ncbi:DUF4397 domain-containing protein [Amnibacterium flavum]|uniref:Cell wall protein n=1 Tax=Amnibacterium flavum TaxID=2173173 RepID=A0A2V1HN80_9MICO|nr:DUF4397 domain-containing protein [Amnibacterium flavum]PVZ93945.1 cell wall protein [Amnibacterium flavum]
MNSTPRSRPAQGFRTALAVGAAALLAAGAALLPATSATAAPDDTGWIRVAHLSPDTKSVDVKLSALAGGDSLYDLSDVGYGVVSDYMPLPAGTYTVAMVGSDAPADSEPAISASVTINAGTASTLAAIGTNSELETKVFTDDLSAPSEGAARVRLVQASTTSDKVDVATTTGLSIAKGAPSGTATGYAEVPAGPWNLTVRATSARGAASVDLPVGSVSTLFVLDTPAGGLTITPILDSASAGTMPVGGVETGGGALAHRDDSAAMLLPAGIIATLIAGAGALLVVRARRSAER